MKIVIIYDPPTEACENDELTIINSYHSLVTSSIESALILAGHQVESVEATLELERHLLVVKPDLVFNTSIQSIYGSKYAFAPEILEKLAIPFTGPSSKACENAYDKFKTIEILRKAGVPTPQAITLSDGDLVKFPSQIKFPLFVKPQRGGCSRGISSLSLIKSPDEFTERINAVLDAIKQPVIVEEFLPGREFTVGIIGTQLPRVMPIIEFIYAGSDLPFRSYSKKMANPEIEACDCPANLTTDESETIGNLAIRAFKALECRDYARIDVRMDAFGIPHVLEVNTIPNLEPNLSSFGLMAKSAGITFIELVEGILKSALDRYNLEYNKMAIY
jgi:D-alanine--D-alanine ligase